MSVDERKELLPKVSKGGVQWFMERSNVVSRRQCGKFMISPVKQERMEQEVVHHLGTLKRAFDSGQPDEDVVENVDETIFLIWTMVGHSHSLAAMRSSMLMYRLVVWV